MDEQTPQNGATAPTAPTAPSSSTSTDVAPTGTAPATAAGGATAPTEATAPVTTDPNAASAVPAAPAVPATGTDPLAMPKTTESLGPDPLAKLENDNSAFVLGMVPVIVMGVLALACLALYLHRRRKNWNELDDALRIDGGDTPVGTSGVSAFTTKDMQAMDATQPSQRMSEIKD